MVRQKIEGSSKEIQKEGTNDKAVHLNETVDSGFKKLNETLDSTSKSIKKA